MLWVLVVLDLLILAGLCGLCWVLSQKKVLQLPDVYPYVLTAVETILARNPIAEMTHPQPSHSRDVTLLLLDEEGKVRHEVALHHDQKRPFTYRYGGRLYRCVGQTGTGIWTYRQTGLA